MIANDINSNWQAFHNTGSMLQRCWNS